MKRKMDCPEDPQKSKDTGRCDPNMCNPFMACASGNFYIMENELAESYMVLPHSEKINTVNDNRLASCLSDCWHPPEVIIV
jgi:hypothetical protein